ncbi:MAG: RidA family protein [Planctomycetota bacterium]|nr:MAG: RidA family protein [Planctomycetota bacterium]
MNDSRAVASLQVIQPEGWPRPSGYANGIRVPAGRELLFVAGQVAWDTDQRMVSGGFVAQFRQALANCLAVVSAAGGRPNDVVRLTIYVTDKAGYMDNLRAIGEAWKELMGRHYPVMALVQVAALVEPGGLVEIEATAALEPAGSAGGER